MMAVALVALLLSAVSAHPLDPPILTLDLDPPILTVDLPSFQWIDRADPPILTITFPDGGLVDRAHLTEYNPIPVGPNERAENVDRCIFTGNLENEANVPVTVLGCAHSNTFKILFQSKRLRDYMFNVVDGKVERIARTLGSSVLNRDGSFTLNKDIALPAPYSKIASPLSRAAVDTRGYSMNVMVRYDDSFKAKWGDDSVNCARRVMAIAQTQYNLKDSLTTTIQLNIDSNVEYIAGKTWVAEKDLDAAAALSTDSKYDAYVYLSYRNNQAGTLGIGYTGSTCDDSVNYRSSINEWQGDDLNTGLTIAHEMGHNLGMKHDFDATTANPYIPRFDSKKQPCSKVGGIMDYEAPFFKWTTCSVEDFTAYVGSLEKFCLKVNA